jgi:hypothetical protein
MPPPLDLDPVSLLHSLVAAFRLVFATMKSRVTVPVVPWYTHFD